MADRMYAVIHIPTRFIVGNITKEIKEEFDLDDEDLEEIIASAENGVAEFSAEEVAWGKFNTLEEALIEEGVPFNRHSDGKYEFGPETRIYRPATISGQPEIDLIRMENNGGEPYMLCKDLEVFASLPAEEVKAKLEAGLAELLPDNTSPLTAWASKKIQSAGEAKVANE